MDFLELAHTRFSVLEYDRKKVEQDKIDRIIEAAIAAPTACNYQPQKILIIDSDELKERLQNVVPSKYYVPVAFLVCYNRDACWTRPMDGKASGDVDAAIVTTHMMLEATELGLGSIWVMYWNPQKMKQAFELAENLEPVALLIVGYPATDVKPKPGHLKRKTAEEILL